ncbi:MAG: hypothetical protein ACRD12_21675 [Acidimicrobiales bacterium]
MALFGIFTLLGALAATTAAPMTAQTPPPILTLTPSSGPPGASFTVSGRCPTGGGTVLTQLTRDGADVGEGSGAGAIDTDGSFSVAQRIPSIRTPGATPGEGEFYQPGAQYAVTAQCPNGFEFPAQPFDVVAPRPVTLTG